VFGIVGLMIAYVFQHNESFLWHPDDPIWKHYEGFKWYLLPHGLAGACAILLGPLQFSDRLRQRYAKFHRVIGRIYVFGAMVVAPLGVYLQYFDERVGGPRSFTLAAATDAALLMLTTGIAFGFILKGKVQQHRQWMTRSFAIAIVFLEVRVISGLGGWDDSLKITETIVWICLGFSVLVGDIALQVQESLRTRPFGKVQAAAR
jgi:uncharacterized membrane protein